MLTVDNSKKGKQLSPFVLVSGTNISVFLGLSWAHKCW